MNFKNVILLSLLAANVAGAKVSFRVSIAGGVVRQTAKMDQSVSLPNFTGSTGGVAGVWAAGAAIPGYAYPGVAIPAAGIGAGIGAPIAAPVLGSAAFPTIGKAGVNLQTEADKKKTGIFGTVLVNAVIKGEKGVGFGAFAGLFLNGSAPRKEDLDTNYAQSATANNTAAIPVAGAPAPVAAAAGTTTGVAKFKNRGVMLAVGPEIGMSKGKFFACAKLGITFSGYKFRVTDAGGAALAPIALAAGGNDVIVDSTTNIELRTKMLRKIGVMPMIKLGYKFGAVNVFALVGHNFSSKATLKNPANAVNPQAGGAAAGSGAQQALYRAGVDGIKVKTCSTYFGVGLSTKLAG